MSPSNREAPTSPSSAGRGVVTETLTLEAGERGEILLYPETDVRDPVVTVDGPRNFAVKDVLVGDLPAPSVTLLPTQPGSWRARVGGILAGPERFLKVLVWNTSSCKITLRASTDEEQDP